MSEPPVSIWRIALVFNRISLSSFGGGLSAWSRRVVVEEQRWMEEAEFLSAMTLCRVLPGAKTTPKNLLNVVDRPILSYVVEEARAAGIEHIVFIVGRGQGAIEDYFDHHVELEAELAKLVRM